jgi:hypothetical protein
MLARVVNTSKITLEMAVEVVARAVEAVFPQIHHTRPSEIHTAERVPNAHL